MFVALNHLIVLCRCLAIQYNDSMASNSKCKTTMHCVQSHTQIGYITVAVFSVDGHNSGQVGKFNETHLYRSLLHKWCLVELLITMVRGWTVPACLEKKRKGHAEASSHAFLHQLWTQWTVENKAYLQHHLKLNTLASPYRWGNIWVCFCSQLGQFRTSFCQVNSLSRMRAKYVEI